MPKSTKRTADEVLVAFPNVTDLALAMIEAQLVELGRTTRERRPLSFVVDGDAAWLDDGAAGLIRDPDGVVSGHVTIDTVDECNRDRLRVVFRGRVTGSDILVEFRGSMLAGVGFMKRVER